MSHDAAQAIHLRIARGIFVKHFRLSGYHVARVGAVAIARFGERRRRRFDDSLHRRSLMVGGDALSDQKASSRRNHRTQERLRT